MAKPIEPVYRQIGAKIESIRRVLGLSQDEVAQRVGLNRTSIVNIEAGRQRILLHDAEKLANALGTSVKNLMRGIWL